MAELPEISKFSKQMHETLLGREIAGIDLLQEKCSNVTAEEMKSRLTGRKIVSVTYRGKWILFTLDKSEYILLSVGMGADMLYHEADASLPDKYQFHTIFTDGCGFTIRFWWFGKILVLNEAELASDKNTKDLGIDPFNPAFTYDYFTSLLKGKKTQVKSFLMNQKNISGIGNMYMHDILFQSRIHPQKKISDLTEAEIQNLYNSIMKILSSSRDKGAFYHELDFFGQNGGYKIEDFLIGYQEGQECPVCGHTIEQIKTGSTSSYICTQCQPLP